MLIITVTDLRTKSKELLDQIIEKDEVFIVTRYGRPVVVLLGYDRYNDLLDRLSVLEKASAESD